MATWGEHGVTPDHRDQADPVEGDGFDAQEERDPSFRSNTDAEGMMRALDQLGIRFDGGI
jgi:hypothetical protein